MSKRLSKRRDDIDVDEVLECVNLDRGLVDGLLDLTRDELAAVLADIANKGDISTATFKKARTCLPSFSTVKWTDFAVQFGLPTDSLHLRLTKFSTPTYRLPPSFQKAMFESAWRWQDVCRETLVKTGEEARMRILDQYIVPIIALFQGRVIDTPDKTLMGTRYSTGGEIGHEVFMTGGILFFIIEMKSHTPDPNALAQLYLELLSAAEENKLIDFAGFRVYGLLTDLSLFDFYSYDPTAGRFCFDERMFVSNMRPAALIQMIDVSNKIFGLVVTAYMEGLRATMEKSRARAEGNDFSPVGSSPDRPEQKPSQLTGKGKTNGGRKSTDQFEAALALAQLCCDKFDEPVTTVEDMEDKGNKALELLIQSVRLIPRASTFTGRDDDSMPAMLGALADRLINEKYKDDLAM